LSIRLHQVIADGGLMGGTSRRAPSTPHPILATPGCVKYRLRLSLPTFAGGYVSP